MWVVGGLDVLDDGLFGRVGVTDCPVVGHGLVGLANDDVALVGC